MHPTPFLTKLAAAWPADQWRDVTVLVAVSGGADSVALLRGLLQLRVAGEGKLVVAHFNHQLRGADSDADQRFVEQLARECGCGLAVGTASGELAASHGGGGLEGAARAARYEFLAQAADELGARYVVTAHTADDQVETILFNFLRGTGLAGLAGIPRIRLLTGGAVLVRPLLGVNRSEVLSYLQAICQTNQEDTSNQLPDFTRNRIRHQLLPLLEQQFNPQVRDALLRLGSIAHEADELLESQAAELVETHVRPISGGIELPTGPLIAAPALLGRYALRHLWRRAGWPLQDMSYDKWEQLHALACAPALEQQVTRQSFPGNVLAERHAGTLRLTCGS